MRGGAAVSNRVAAANDALWDLLEETFTEGETLFRNPDGQRAFGDASLVVSMDDDEEPEVLRVMMGGPSYDLKLVPVVTLARKALEGARREDAWTAVETLRVALAADPTLGGAVEDARIEMSEPSQLDRARWLAGGVDLSIRLLFAAPSPAG